MSDILTKSSHSKSTGSRERRCKHRSNKRARRATADPNKQRENGTGRRRDAEDSVVPCNCECLATLGRFAASVVHEVNNPLGAALATTQIALRLAPEQASPRIAECLARTAASIRRASELVKQLLILCDEPTDDKNAFDPHVVLRSAKTATANQAKRRHCRVRLRLGPQPTLVLGNSMQMSLAIVSLIVRAIEAGARTITLATTSAAHSCEIRILDDARDAAIAEPRDQTQIDVGRYADSSCAHALVNRIVQSHGGRLEVCKRPKLGSAVRICLPGHTAKGTKYA